MNYKSIIKKQSFIITASVIVMAIILLGTSYALFTNRDNSDTQVVSSGTLTVSYSGSTITTVGGVDGSGNLLEIEPLDEATVDAQNPYVIKVNNTGSLALRYNIVIYTDTTNTLPHSYYSLKYKDNGSYTNKVALTSLTKADPTKTNMNEIKYVLTSQPFVLEPGREATHEIHLWIDEDTADTSISNKVANIKIAVDGEATNSTPAYQIVSGNLNTIGSIVKIANEEFYVYGQEDSEHVKLLSKWNLNVGPNAKGTATNLQDSEVVGEKSGYSSTPYWHDTTNNKMKDEYGGYLFNTTDNLYVNSSGNFVHAYIYTNNKANGTYLASIAEYVDNYVAYLTNQGANVSGRLISKEELEELGCPVAQKNELSINCSSAPSWISNTSYWTGSNGDNDDIWRKNGGENTVFSRSRCTRNDYFGVRPVIILKK